MSRPPNRSVLDDPDNIKMVKRYVNNSDNTIDDQGEKCAENRELSCCEHGEAHFSV